MVDYDDITLVAAIAGAKTVRKAQSATRVHIATLYRRLRDLERRAGGPLFERVGNELVATARAQPFLDASNDLADRLADVERRVAAHDDRLHGELKVTTADSLLQAMCRCLMDFRQDHPEIRISLDISHLHADLGRREADVAVRPTNTPPESLIGRKVATFEFAPYRAPGAAVLPGWIGFTSDMASVPAVRWHAENVPDRDINLRVNAMAGAATAAAAGWGKALLPSYLAADHGLVLAGEPIALLRSEIWVLFHSDLKISPRVRTFTEFSARLLKKQLGSSVA